MNSIETTKYPLGITERQLSQTLNYLQVWASIEHTVSMKEIAVNMQSSERIAREVVKVLREKQKPIGSDGSGYWYARTAEQLEPAIRYAKSFRDSHALTVDYLEKTQEDMVMTEQIEATA
jgi:hypothetical protein